MVIVVGELEITVLTCNTVLSAWHKSTYLILRTGLLVVSTIIIPILQVKKLRHRIIMELIQGHIASKWELGFKSRQSGFLPEFCAFHNLCALLASVACDQNGAVLTVVFSVSFHVLEGIGNCRYFLSCSVLRNSYFDLGSVSGDATLVLAFKNITSMRTKTLPTACDSAWFMVMFWNICWISELTCAEPLPHQTSRIGISLLPNILPSYYHYMHGHSDIQE